MYIKNFPNLRQAYDFDCGATAIQSVLAYYGIDTKESLIMKIAGTTKTGTTIEGVKKVAKKYGLKTKFGEMTIEEVKKYVAKKIPVIILIQAWTKKKNVNWEKNWTDGHYVVAIGYDKDKIYFEDPASIYITYLTHAELEKRWHGLKDMVSRHECINYGIAIYGKKPLWRPNKIIHMD